MKPLYTPEEFKKATSNQLLLLECSVCKKEFYKKKRIIKKVIREDKGHTGKFCSHKCFSKTKENKKTISCSNCKDTFKRWPSGLKDSKNHFCSQSCSATYNNKHKTHGTRRSKLEVWLEKKLNTLFPGLDIHYNRKDAINSELDIYIPKLSLAIELNGIFHYEPIFGEDKLEKIQNNDSRKFQACLENNIELLLIDTSSLSYFKPKKAQKYLNIITEIIDKKAPRPSRQ